MPWVDKDKWTIASDAIGRRSGKTQRGGNGDHVTPGGYYADYGNFPTGTPELPNGARQPDVDVPNLYFFHNAGILPHARNKAWSQLVQKVRSGPASLGVAIAEARESLAMITARFSQLYRGYRNLRRGNFRGFLHTFGIGPKRKHRKKIRNTVSEVSSLWLEYSFGWAPLFKDIYDGCHAMGSPIPSGKFSGSGMEDYSHDSSSESFSTRGICKMGAKVSIDNPNAYLAQQLGLANPLQIAWELVPFSFVVDWVFDVGSFLGALTDLFGCVVQDGYTTYFAKATVTCYWDRYTTNPKVLSGRVAYVRRNLGLELPVPNTDILSNLGSSIKRAANAAALLGQFMAK